MLARNVELEEVKVLGNLASRQMELVDNLLPLVVPLNKKEVRLVVYLAPLFYSVQTCLN